MFGTKYGELLANQKRILSKLDAIDQRLDYVCSAYDYDKFVDKENAIEALEAVLESLKGVKEDDSSDDLQ